MMLVSLFLVIFATVALADNATTTRHCVGDCQRPDPHARMTYVMQLKLAEHRLCASEHLCPLAVPRMSYTACAVDGHAGEYECNNVDMMSLVPLEELGCGGDANDIWGWTDALTNREYALVGCEDGTSFVDVTEADNPTVLGFLKTHTTSSLWRDLKVYKDHVFIISEAYNHGMQIFDLTQLRDVKPGDFEQFTETAFYGEFGSSHNIVANEETGFMYSVGSRTCTSGLHMVDVRDPTNPKFAGCYGDDGYVHDAQCVVYNGPDSRYKSNEICFCYNEDTLTIVDVTDKQDPKMLAREPYNGAYYTHQGWVNEDHSHLLLNDELDELQGSNPHTRSLIWSVEDLTKPVLLGSFYSDKESTDHNLYLKDNIAYESNYCAGLRVLDVTKMNEGNIEEIGYFDVDPNCNEPGFHGAWSSYPYFSSGNIIVSSIERGLFVLKFNP